MGDENQSGDYSQFVIHARGVKEVVQVGSLFFCYNSFLHMDTFFKIMLPKVHKGLTIITWATAIRWIGWGFVEALLPIFLFSFAHSYAGTGFLRSIYSVVFLLSVPIIGAMANQVRAKNLILTGLLIYPFIGLAYYFAGLWGAISFIIIARVLNGVSFALDNVGRMTYLRKHENIAYTGSAIGYMQTVSYFWWLASILFSSVLIKYFEIYEFFLLIIPTTLVAFFIMLKVPVDPEHEYSNNWEKFISWRTYKNFLEEIVIWNKDLKRLAVLNSLLQMTIAIVVFFMPIILFEKGDSFQQIIFFTFIFYVPVLLSGTFGWFADRIKPEHVTLGFLLLAVLLGLVGFSSSYNLQLALVFFLSAVAVFLRIFVDAEMTRRGDSRKYGTLTGASLEIGELSSIAGPILIGAMIDLYSMQIAFLALAILIILVSVVFRPVHHEIKRVPVVVEQF